MLTFIIFGLTDVVGSGNTSAALILLQYLAQLVAGYVGGRLAGAARVLNGSLAAELFFVVTAGVSLAGGGDAGPLVIVAFAAVALVIGAAGGALAEWQSQRARPENA